MTDNIHPLRNGEIVPVIEDLLERAKRGEIVSLAYAGVCEDQATIEGVGGRIYDNAVLLNGAINILRDMYFHMHIEHYADAEVT